MPDATPTLGPTPHASLFTRLAAVEVELEGLKDLVASLKADHDAMRKDRDEWRRRAERLLADQERGFWERMSNRVETAFGRVIGHLWTLVRALLATVPQAIRRGPLWFARLKFDEPQDDATVTLAGAAHGPHPVHDGRLDLDEALVSVTLHRPSR
jgi:FtsZ-binding cell division protein ZapB